MTGFLSNDETEICLSVLPLSSECIRRKSSAAEKSPAFGALVSLGVGALVSAPGANGGRRCSDHLAGTFCDDAGFQANA